MIFRNKNTVQEYLIEYKDITKVKVKKSRNRRGKAVNTYNQTLPDYYLVIKSFALDKETGLRVDEKMKIFDNREERLKEISC